MDFEAIIAIPLLIAIAVFSLWLFWFGGLETVTCSWLGLETFAVCN